MKGAFSRLVPAKDGLHRLRLADGQGAIAKRRHDMPHGFFAAEARGLEALRDTSGLRVPQVHALGEHWILIEDLGNDVPGPDFQAEAGRGLARQHACLGQRFGFGANGWCGDSPQDNTWDTDGHRFFAERRLLPQARRAFDQGRLDTDDIVRIETICRCLPDLVPAQPPALLHGDLWQGNLHVCGNGEPALIDAGAVHYGWVEAELAMLMLFGVPPQALFDTYASSASLANDWRERASLYNLYHLLNHLNLFGGGYHGGVRRILDRFA